MKTYHSNTVIDKPFHAASKLKCNMNHSIKLFISNQVNHASVFLITTLLILFTSSLVHAATTPPPPVSRLCLEPQGNCASTASTTAPETTGTKWNPGHYMLVYFNTPQSIYDDIFSEPNVKGVQVRYYWSELETEKGVYDFSKIESDLRYLEAHGKRLVMQLQDRRSAKSTIQFVPDYLLNDPIYKGGIYNTMPRLWDPVVMDRMIELGKALGNRFDKEPYFEALNFPATAPGFFGDVKAPSDYTRSKYAEQIKRRLAETKAAFPHTNVIQYADFLIGEISGIIEQAYNVGAGTGAPDIIPNDPAEGDIVRRDYIDLSPVGQAVQAPELCGKEGCNLPQDLYNYAVNKQKINYMFWIRFGTSKDTATEKYSWKYGILPTINENPRTNETCPTQIAPCITN